MTEVRFGLREGRIGKKLQSCSGRGRRQEESRNQKEFYSRRLSVSDEKEEKTSTRRRTLRKKAPMGSGYFNRKRTSKFGIRKAKWTEEERSQTKTWRGQSGTTLFDRQNTPMKSICVRK